MLYSQEYYMNGSEKDAALFSIYKEFILRHTDLSGKSLLDIGCGTGKFFEVLADDMNLVGLDTSEYAISFCREKFQKNKKFIQYDLEKNIPFLEAEIYDVITCFDAIEHLMNFENLGKIIENNLKEGGLFVLTTPNAESLFHYLGGKKDLNSAERDPTHRMIFTPYTLDFFLRRIGLQKKELCTPYFFYFQNNFITQKLLFGGQIFAIYSK